MSSISSVSATRIPQQSSNKSNSTQLITDFNSIGAALQSGNVNAAQSAIATFQRDLQSSAHAGSTNTDGALLNATA